MSVRWEGGIEPDDEIRKLRTKVEFVQKKATLAGMDTAVRSTRVDTGRARGSWIVSAGSESGGEGHLSSGRKGSPPDGQHVSQAGAALGSFEIGQSTFIQSNLDYIEHLNDGTEKMSGDHMRELAERRVEAELQQGFGGIK